jgi:tetratricopeptide (TPR) repeat protein
LLDVSLPKRFRVLRQLGEGGMGVVYEAHDDERGARVALKTVPNMTPAALARFKREFRAVADVQHPNLVSLGELVAEGDKWFFTMELVEGGDFLEHVQPRGGSLDEVRLRSALAQLTSALEALHAGGIAHRDVKPANVRVTPSGRVVLLDFGLAADFTRTGSQTQARMAGTPAYMAPEQAASGAVGPAADWYAVGVVLFHALTGALPFEGTPLAMMIEKQQDGPAPSARAPNVPADLDELCARLLRFDPSARATGTDLNRVLGGDAGARRPAQSSSLTEVPPFIGRAKEIAALRAAFADSRRDAVTVLVEGESGVGKSCLVRRFVEALSTEVADLVVLTGRCYEREAVPYKAFDGVVDALTRFLMREAGESGRFVPTYPEALARVFPVLRRVEAFASAPRKLTLDPLEIRSRAFAGLRDMLTRISHRRPLVVVIDDFQWADTDSLTLLAEVLRPPEAPAMLLAATVRASPPGEDKTFRTLTAASNRKLGQALLGDVRSVEVAQLSSGEARELATALVRRTGRSAGGADAGESVDGAAEAIAREAGGHPFFIDALVRHAALGGGVGAGGLDEALWSSVTILEPTARRIVELLAVAAAPVTQEVLAVAADVPPDAYGRLLARLRVAHLISVTGVRAGDTAEPYHDRVRAAVLAHKDESARAELHGALARALEKTESQDVEALALHWRGAGDGDRAAAYAARAADAAAGALAFDRATKLYEAALELGHHDGAERSALFEKLGDALANAGRGRRAAEAYAKAARGAQAARALDLQRRGADQLLRAGHLDEGLATFGGVLASIGLALPRSPLTAVAFFLLCRAYLRVRGLGFRTRDPSEIAATELTRIDICWSVAVGLAFADNLRAAAFQARSLVLALWSGDRSRIARAVAAEAGYVSRTGEPAIRRTEALLRRAHELAAESADPYATGWAHAASGVAYYFAGRYKRALEHLDHARAVWAELPGALWEMDTSIFYSLSSLVQLGEVARVGREMPRALRDARQRGDLYAAVNLRIGPANLAWLAQDDARMALTQIDAAMSEWSNRGFHVEHYFELLARANALVYGDRGPEAYGHVRARWPALRRSLLPFALQVVRVNTLHARARCAIAVAERGGAERDRLLRDAAACARRIERERTGYATSWAKLARAGIAATRGDRDRAALLLRDAASGFDAADMALYAAAARRTLGKLVGGDEGRVLVERAEAWMRAETVKNPARMTAMLAPGFAKVE